MGHQKAHERDAVPDQSAAPAGARAADEAAPAAAALRAGRMPTAGGVLALQRSAGNAAVGRLLRSPDPFLDAVTGPLAKAYEEARKAKEAYVKSGTKGPITYDPSKRNKQNYYGGFDVEYDPDKGVLTIRMRGVAEFKPGMRLRKGRAVAVEPSPQTKTEADKINKDKDPAKRAAAVAKWQWSSAGGPDAGDEAKFMADFKTAVESAWQGKHPFYCWRPWWEDLGAEVVIDVQLVQMDATNKPGSPFHMKTNVYKVPADYIGGQADVHRTGGNAAKSGPFANVMTLTAVDVNPRRDGLLTRSVGFDPGSSTLTKKQIKSLTAMAKQMPNAPAGATVAVSDVTASAQGADDAERKARFEAIAKVFTDAGMARDRLKYLDGGVGDVVELTIGGGKAQTVAAHESGHMFGLDDEYTGSGAYAAGKKTEHTDFAAKANEIGIRHGKSDNIMSEGSVVRQQHYVTFLDALKVVSGIEEWTFGAAHYTGPPSPYQDAPTPGELGPDTRRGPVNAVA